LGRQWHPFALPEFYQSAKTVVNWQQGTDFGGNASYYGIEMVHPNALRRNKPLKQASRRPIRQPPAYPSWQNIFKLRWLNSVYPIPYLQPFGRVTPDWELRETIATRRRITMPTNWPTSYMPPGSASNLTNYWHNNFPCAFIIKSADIALPHRSFPITNLRRNYSPIYRFN
jgi:hypothetical protein